MFAFTKTASQTSHVNFSPRSEMALLTNTSQHNMTTPGDLSPADAARLKEAKELYNHVYDFSRAFLKSSNDHSNQVSCSVCDASWLDPPYYLCLDCADFPICAQCESEGSHQRSHLLYKINVPPPPTLDMKEFNVAPWQMRENVRFQIEGSYKLSLPYSWHKQLVKGSPMPITESEALYEVFKCLATTNYEPEEEDEEVEEPEVEETNGWLQWGLRVLAIRAGGIVPPRPQPPPVWHRPQEEPEIRERQVAVSKECFCELFPSVYSSDSFLANFFFAIYDLNNDGLVDFSEFVKAHIVLTYSTDAEKVDLAVKLLAVAQFLPETETFKFWATPSGLEIFTEVGHFINILRRLLYSYFDMSKYIFADALQLQQQQLAGELGFNSKYKRTGRLPSDIEAANARQKVDTHVWSKLEANWTDTRMNYYPISRDTAVEGNVSNFQLEQVEQSLLELKEKLEAALGDTWTLKDKIPVEEVSHALASNPFIADSLVACVEAALI